jgi:hypothetical protein
MSRLKSVIQVCISPLDEWREWSPELTQLFFFDFGACASGSGGASRVEAMAASAEAIPASTALNSSFAGPIPSSTGSLLVAEVVIAITGAAADFGRLCIHQRDYRMIGEPPALDAIVVNFVAES